MTERRSDEASPIGSVRNERLALAWLAGAAVLVIVRIVIPVGLGILLGALTAFTAEPLFKRLEARTGRSTLSSLILVLGTAVLLVGSATGLALLFIDKGVGFGEKLVTSFAPGGNGGDIVATITKRLGRFGVNHAMIMEKLRNGAADVAAHAASAAGEVASVAGEAMLALFFMLLTMHLFLRSWDKMLPRAVAVFPLRPEYTRALFEEFRKVGRTTLQGTVVTGIAQGLLAGIGFAIAGVEDASFFGAATAIASLIPAVGTLLVWVPIGVYLLVTGHTVAGVFELAWGMFAVVGASDYVIRPRLVGGDESTPALLMFASLLGGVEVFGLQGLIVGPLLMGLALAVLRIYERETLAQREEGKRPEDRDRVESALGNLRDEPSSNVTTP